MDYSWITTSWMAAWMVVLTTAGIYVALIVLTRIAGLRSFSKMSSFDFAITVAIGSVIGSTVLTKDPPLNLAVVALAALYLMQILIASLRGRSSVVSRLVNNEPLLLMKGTEVLEENLKKAKVTHADLHAKLREANVTQLHQIKAVVMEATGDVSVLHNDDPDHELDEELLKEVRIRQ
ncbi:DUF421 domain-containing protein [Fodinibius sediminis]|uniref:Uncharacterized membrane protein YcaP, DUF421 family n=1 Tax=Fodinibius sediminis TaxID=1214077 RepID=A0A521D975_9BACT|nr:YetF domain-containing protein [Fodinibius sediminis]SMO68264.1 Uncharacterized membrane protein YcaP, DUF421 family [Fodinibius sediminis]